MTVCNFNHYEITKRWQVKKENNIFRKLGLNCLKIIPKHENTNAQEHPSSRSASLLSLISLLHSLLIPFQLPLCSVADPSFSSTGVTQFLKSFPSTYIWMWSLFYFQNKILPYFCFLSCYQGNVSKELGAIFVLSLDDEHFELLLFPTYPHSIYHSAKLHFLRCI